jgi:hypothetical protein
MLPIVQSPRLRPAGILFPKYLELHLNENEPLVKPELKKWASPAGQDARFRFLKFHARD